MEKFLKLEKEKLLNEVVEVLREASYYLSGGEIARQIIVKHYGEDWWKQKGSHYICERLGMRIIQLLGMKPQGEANRERLGIDYSVSGTGNYPLTFWLKSKKEELSFSGRMQ